MIKWHSSTSLIDIRYDKVALWGVVTPSNASDHTAVHVSCDREEHGGKKMKKKKGHFYRTRLVPYTQLLREPLAVTERDLVLFPSVIKVIFWMFFRLLAVELLKWICI